MNTKAPQIAKRILKKHKTRGFTLPDDIMLSKINWPQKNKCRVTPSQAEPRAVKLTETENSCQWPSRGSRVLFFSGSSFSFAR